MCIRDRLNGLGTVKYEELYLTYGTVARLLGEHGYTVVDAEVGEQCTSCLLYTSRCV